MNYIKRYHRSVERILWLTALLGLFWISTEQAKLLDEAYSSIDVIFKALVVCMAGY